MSRRQRRSTGPTLCALAALVGSFGLARAADASADATSDGPGLRVSGYVRQYFSINTQDHQSTGAGDGQMGPVPPTANCGFGQTCADYNDRGKLQMVRTQARLNFSVGTERVSLKGIARAEVEANTAYLKELERRGAAPGLRKRYDEAELRELFVDVKASDTLSFRLGKQQIVWEEADFPILDVIHGVNIRWRGPTEIPGEAEEFRKPLIMALASFRLPELEGRVDAFIRPGWDGDRDIGVSADDFGGRWTYNFAEGVDNRANLINDPDHPKGRFDKVTGGLRWSQKLGRVSYSVLAFTAAAPAVVNPCLSAQPFGPFGPALATFGAQPYERAARCGAGGGGFLGDLVQKVVPVVGGTANVYAESIGAVLTGVVAYSPKNPFNVGSGFFFGALPGLQGVAEKDVMKWSARIDKSVDMSFLGTWRESDLALQLAGTHIRGFDAADDLVQSFLFHRKLKRSAYTLTGRITLPYQGDNWVGSAVLSKDLTYGGGFISPQLDYQIGNNWRFRLQYDHFFSKQAKVAPVASPSNGALTEDNVTSAFKDKDLLTLRLTYQF
jgi:hypothetical protein